MLKIAIVTDSTAYLPTYTRDELKIKMIPLAVTIGHEIYNEELDISSTEFYRKVKNTDLFPKTSQPSTGQFVELFESLKEEGFEQVIAIHLSSGISGTYAGAIQAGEMVEGIEVFAFDTEISCYLQGFYVIRAAQLANEGKDVATILAELKEMQKTMQAYFIVDDLTHLQRGGRLSGAQAFIGGLLQIKPILHFEEKVIVPFEKIRTTKKAMNRIAELLKVQAEKMPLEAVIIHGNRPVEAKKWREQLSEELPNVHFTISHFGPVIGTHLGEGAMGLGWVKCKE